MATREQLIEALRNADASGDQAGAEKLAAALQRMNTPTPPSPSGPLMEGSGGDGMEAPAGRLRMGPDGTMEQYAEKDGGGFSWIKANPEAFKDQFHAQGVMDEYEAMPWYQKAGYAANDIARLGLGGATFGFNDKFSHLWGGQDPEAARQSTEDARTRAGGAGSVIEALGMMAVPGLGIESTMAKGSSALQKLLGYGSAAAMEGGVAGGLNAAGHDEDIAEGAKSGAIFGPLARLGVEGLSRGGSKVAGIFNKNQMIPTEEELRAIADTNYRKMRKERINVKTGKTAPLRGKIMQDMRRFELDDIVHPKATRRTRVLDEKLSRPTGISLSRLDAQRSAINRDIPGETAGGQTAGILRGNIDDFIERMDPTFTTGGRNPADAIEYMKKGRDFTSRAANMGEVDAASEAAERAAARGKTSDIDAAIRSKFEPLVVKGPLGKSPEEFEQIEDIVGGKGIRKAMQQLGRLSPTNWSGMGGVGIGGGVGTGLLIGSPTLAGVLGIGLPAAGFAGKKVADRMSRNMVEDLKGMTAAGGKAMPKVTNAVQDALMGGKDRAKRLAQMWAIANSNGAR